MEAVSERPSAPARIAGRYEVLAELGKGGMAVAYHVRDAHSGQELALKQLQVSERGLEAVELFEREFHTLNQLAHPRVVRAFDYGRDGDQPYYTMELLDGGDLRALAPMPWQAACSAAYDVCSALSLLHSRQLVHRDLTPRNVRCTSDGKAKLIDFGLLTPFGPCHNIAGTPPYVAPELVHGMSLDGRSDLFSLGATLYHVLTGRVAYPARRFEQLRDMWRGSPAPISRIVPDVPEALETLIMAMLRLDASSRPKTAAEVMHRLRPLLAERPDDSLSVASSHLIAPKLVGRTEVIASLRMGVLRAVRRRGQGFVLTGASGSGRSRVIDAFVLEAKLLGAATARAGLAEAASGPWGAARAIVAQIHASQPSASWQAARAHDASWRVLFGDRSPEQAGDPLDIARPGLERGAVQDGILAWLRRLADTRLVAVAVDDLDMVDEPSQALLAAIALEANATRMAYACAVHQDALQTPLGPLRVLQGRAEVLALAPLEEPQTRELLQGVFGEVAHLDGLSNLLHQASRGLPGDCMTLAQGLVDRNAITYVDGSWRLPSSPNAALLPSDVSDATVHQIARLDPDARQIGQLISLCVLKRLDRAQLSQLTGLAPYRVEEATDTLRMAQLLSGSPAGYTVGHAGVERAFIGSLTHEELPMLQDRLALALENAAAGQIPIAYHALQGQAPTAALGRLLVHARTAEQRTKLVVEATDTLGSEVIGQTVLAALDIAVEAGRPTRERFPLWTMLAGIAAGGGDARFYHAVPSEWLEQIKRDSGYHDWHGLAHISDPAERAIQAFVQASQRFEATPVEERCLAPADAIKDMVAFVVFAIAISARTTERSMARMLPSLLAPFAPLNPLVAAMQRNAEAALCAGLGVRERARDIFVELVASLDAMEGVELAFVDRIRAAICQAIANIETSLGIQPDPDKEWLHTEDPSQRSAIEYIKKVAALHRGDWEAAEQHRRNAELLALQSRSGTMFSTLGEELEAHAAARDLTGLAAVRDRMEDMARQYRGWVPAKLAADACYSRLCGAPEETLELVAQLRDAEGAAADSSRWVAFAAVPEVEALLELDRAQEALARGLAALELCQRDDKHHLARALELSIAMVEATLGKWPEANKRVERVLARQQAMGITGLWRGRAHECAARIAIAAGDAEAYHRAAQAAALEYRPGESSVLGALYARLTEDAQKAGLTERAWTDERAAAQDARTSTVASLVHTTMLACDNEPKRAKAALRLLCEGEPPAEGLLFLLTRDGLTLCASTANAAPPEGLLQFARAKVEVEAAGEAYTMTADFDDELDAETTLGVDAEGQDGRRYRPFSLIAERDSVPYILGVALIARTGTPPPGLLELGAAVARQLLESGAYDPLEAA